MVSLGMVRAVDDDTLLISGSREETPSPSPSSGCGVPPTMKANVVGRMEPKRESSVTQKSDGEDLKSGLRT